MTNFEKVGVFMKTFNQDVKNSSSLSTDKINTLRISLINEELEELKQAISEKNLTEVADALTDILYVTYGAGHAFGINLDKAFDIVHKSNMSKLCETEEDAIETVRIYKEKYANDMYNSPYDSPAYRRSKDNKYWVVYNESTGKILKNYNLHFSTFTIIMFGILFIILI